MAAFEVSTEVHGLEESEGTRALVLELVEGPTLADRIAQGPIPVDEALPIAKQIAEALEAAHEAGVIHRDLKPANIKVREDGTVKVLDFGLAKALDTTPEGDPSESPTLTAAAAQMGVIMGTAAYMSPEQARGKPVDKRADIWAFGAVLYEMLTGAKPFRGDDISQTLARVIERDPDWEALPKTLPPALDTYLRRCLQRDPRERVRDIGDVRLAMEGAFETTVEVPASIERKSHGRLIPALIGALVVSVVGMAIITIGPWNLARPGVPKVTRYSVSTPPRGGRPDVVSPDGRMIAFSTALGGDLFVRRLDQLEAAPLRGAEGTEPICFSPDGQWLLVSDGDSYLRVPIDGGPASRVTDDLGGGADWGPDDTIVAASQTGGLWIGTAAGGDFRPLIEPSDDGPMYLMPKLLPNGRAVVFHTYDQRSGAQVALYDFETGHERVLWPGSSPHYATSGHLVFWHNDGVPGSADAGNPSLRAAPFDANRLEVTGEVRPVLQGVPLGGLARAPYDLARDGTLVYRHADSPAPSRRGATQKTLCVSATYVSRGEDGFLSLASRG